ncbi:MAG: Ig-like domain-containing protein [Caldilineaceae bacterium]
MSFRRLFHRPFFVLAFLLTLLLPGAIDWGGAPSKVRAADASARLALPAAQSTLPPTLLSTTPADGAAWDGGPVTFTFDQPLDPGAEAAFTIEPALDGDITLDGDNLIFTPTSATMPGERYHFTLDADAQGANGMALGTPAAISVVAATPLAVTSTQPSDGAVEISVDSQIVVVFNKPVVELVGVDDQSALPQPLTIEPTVDGTGSWLNTSIYVFQPTLGLAGGTAYNVTVADLAAFSGELLGVPYTFGFTTAAPIVTGVQSNSKVTPYFNGPRFRRTQPSALALASPWIGRALKRR